MTASAPTARPLTGRFVLIAIVAFFAVVIGVNVLMMQLAITTLPGTEVDSAYSASLAYEGEIQAARQQDLRKWQVDEHIERRPDGTATLTVHAKDANGTSLAGLNFSGRLERPTDRRADQAIDMVDSGNGTYRGTAQDIAAGLWDLVIEADTKGQRMFLSRNRVVLN
ncbi:FixH family protein [Bradyrhizobium sp. dw_78]|uniref:FixH family protein n=1 Tax=Bradyrhizobium sp. dw_78 TaxID=2719793 RepID=UPI001BD4A670|nr:FixH family protein [Bradyrhizobium sp. dw_78]